MTEPRGDFRLHVSFHEAKIASFVGREGRSLISSLKKILFVSSLETTLRCSVQAALRRGGRSGRMCRKAFSRGSLQQWELCEKARM